MEDPLMGYWRKKKMGFYQDMAAERLAKQKMGPSPKYRVLSVDMLKQADREKAATLSSFVQSEADAHTLAGHDNFAYKDLDRDRRIGVVTCRGVEVLLLFKRQIQELEPGPADPVPEKVINDPKDVWIQVDLLNSDPVEQRKGLGDRLSSALKQVSRLQLLWQGEEGRRKQAEEELAKGTKDKETLRVLRERLALLEVENKTLTSVVEGLRNDVRREKEGRKTEKNEIVQEMFPVFNTVWLAGLHRVGDSLYSIIKKQLTDALAKIGVSFVEPALGDTFDPSQHHAVHGVPYPTGSREIGTVVQIHRVGWMMNKAVVEAADVAVGVESKQEEVKNDEPGTAETVVADASNQTEVPGSN